MTKAFIQRSITQHIDVILSLERLIPQIETAARLCAESLENSGKVVFCGNGGSASDSQHFAAELMGRLKRDRRPLAALALTADSAVTSCISNDFGYEHVFARQVEGICRRGDVLFILSTSGNSPNVLYAVDAANRLGVLTVGLLGGDGGGLSSRCGLSLCVGAGGQTARIQEAHTLIGHMICGLVEHFLGLESIEDPAEVL